MEWMNAMSLLNIFLGIINLLFLLKIYPDVLTTKINMQHFQAALGAVISKLNSIEGFNIKLGSSFSEFINMTGDMVDKIDDMLKPTGGIPMYRTMDGKFSARSLDELLNKIKKANKESDYLSDEELNKLKELFNSEENDSDDEEEN